MNQIDVLEQRLKNLEQRVARLANRTIFSVPTYNSLNWPLEAIEGQVVLAPVAQPSTYTGLTWATTFLNSNGSMPNPIAPTSGWHTVELHVKATVPTLIEVWVDGISLGNINHSIPETSGILYGEIGNRFWYGATVEVVYYRNTVMGSTRGGSNYFTDGDYGSSTIIPPWSYWFTTNSPTSDSIFLSAGAIHFENVHAYSDDFGAITRYYLPDGDNMDEVPGPWIPEVYISTDIYIPQTYLNFLNAMPPADFPGTGTLIRVDLAGSLSGEQIGIWWQA